ncbi:glutamate racemase [Candidatus Photodesmus katoptron]|uniref:Glutamate racemase n=1 Tax=Candidatus Photodesmus katoptron Akat1 TaxID=1236703 RepID=S3DFY3_9GAMM|nr:glutamate racemase [Candidatus Photodesmus katoptron]EPE37287.1 glutamate racemase [Candidatus Photodesmus katoptron Akat1]KEY90042.1 glutamate racemase [Candidatus Photodesmus katoptron]
MVITLKSNKHILIFDSGVGGLSIYKEIKFILPNLTCTYIFDNEAYPYGELTQNVVIKRVTSYVSSFIKAYPIDLVVIACNTASTVVLPVLREKLSIPCVGVVPAIKPASILTNRIIGLIGTLSTVNCQYTKNLVNNFAKKNTVKMLGSTRLVNVVEEKIRGKKVNINELAEILMPLIGNIDVLVLGCTHFLLIKEEIQLVFGDKVILVDSGKAIAKRVRELLGISKDLEFKKDRKDLIYCSTRPWKQDILNDVLHDIGFCSVRIRLLQCV